MWQRHLQLCDLLYADFVSVRIIKVCKPKVCKVCAQMDGIIERNA